jgi:hypothetical protein
MCCFVKALLAYGHRRSMHMRTVVVLDLIRNSVISRVDPGIEVNDNDDDGSKNSANNNMQYTLSEDDSISTIKKTFSKSKVIIIIITIIVLIIISKVTNRIRIMISDVAKNIYC